MRRLSMRQRRNAVAAYIVAIQKARVFVASAPPPADPYANQFVLADNVGNVLTDDFGTLIQAT